LNRFIYWSKFEIVKVLAFLSYLYSNGEAVNVVVLTQQAKLVDSRSLAFVITKELILDLSYVPSSAYSYHFLIELAESKKLNLAYG
jgi:hypothetical protein